MSYAFTKLSEVPAVSEFPEGANAIIETNGEIKRCPSSGGGSVPKPLTYDYMPEGYPKKSVSFNIEWNGDTSGLVSVADTYYKVANYIAVTKADLVGSMLSLQNDPAHPRPYAIEENEIYDTAIPHAIMVSDYAMFVSEPTSYGSFNFTEQGIYFAKLRGIYAARLSKETITTIADEFLPATTKNTIVFHNDAGTLKHDDGTLVTAQEAYDAFMNSRVLLVLADTTYEAIHMVWYDNNSAQTDTANVGYVQLGYITKSAENTPHVGTSEAGDPSLVPA